MLVAAATSLTRQVAIHFTPWTVRTNSHCWLSETHIDLLTYCFVDLLLTEYGDRPLKLVLKVSGNEVMTGSSSLDTFYEEQPAEGDKPKDKKKKKKKDKDRSLGSPEEDRGKKKV